MLVAEVVDLAGIALSLSRTTIGSSVALFTIAVVVVVVVLVVVEIWSRRDKSKRQPTWLPDSFVVAMVLATNELPPCNTVLD